MRNESLKNENEKRLFFEFYPWMGIELSSYKSSIPEEQKLHKRSKLNKTDT